MSATINTKKRRGWIRWRGVGVTVGFLGALAFNAGFFLDWPLQKLLESFATGQNGAQVSFGTLHLSWWKHTLELGDIQIAETAQPMRNLLRIDRAVIGFLPAELLRNKLYITDVKIEGVRYHTTRDQSGELPIENRLRTGDSPGILDRSSTSLYPSLLNRYPENPLGRLARFSMGLDLQNKIEAGRARLRSLIALQTITRQLIAERASWHEHEDHYPTSQWLAERRQRLAKPERSLATAGGDLKPSVIDELRAARALVAADATHLPVVAGELEQRLRGQAQLVDEDMRALRATLGLPTLDKEDLTPLIFGPRLTGYFGRLGYWIDLVRRRMPKGSRQGTILTGASSGLDVHFPKMSTVPAMTIEHGTIISDTEKMDGGTHIRGSFEGITSDPPILRKPLSMIIDADIPTAGVRNLHFSTLINHVEDVQKETFDFHVESIPLAHWPLHHGSDLAVFLEHGIGRAEFHGDFDDEGMDAHWLANVRNVEYRVTTPYDELAQRLQAIFDRIPDLQVTGRLQGPTGKTELQLHSNLGQRLAVALPTVFKNPLGAVEDSIRKFILDEVYEPRQRLQTEIGNWRTQVAAHTSHALSEIDALIALAEPGHH